jgi:Flp pilus assembly protein TadD
MPALGIAWYQLGVALWNAGDHAGAAAAFTRSLSVGARHLADTAPRRMLAHTHIAIQALESGDKTAAVDHFRQAAHITPENAASWLNLGRALIAQGRKKEAVVACRRGLALAHDPAAAVPCRALLSR